MRKVFLAAFFASLSVVTASSQSSAAKCPDVSVYGPDAVARVGAAVVFRAEISALPEGSTISYHWEVSVGEIIDGQGTNQIRVVATKASSVTANVIINGLPEGCPNMDSDGAGWLDPPPDCPLEYGSVPWREEQGHLDTLMILMRSNPDAQAYVNVSMGSEETLDDTKKHIVKMLKFLKKRDKDFDLGRLTFGIGKAQPFPYGHYVRVFLVALGGNAPKCEDCTMLNGKDLYR